MIDHVFAVIEVGVNKIMFLWQYFYEHENINKKRLFF